jgi:hypothetical protein
MLHLLIFRKHELLGHSKGAGGLPILFTLSGMV